MEARQKIKTLEELLDNQIEKMKQTEITTKDQLNTKEFEKEALNQQLKQSLSDLKDKQNELARIQKELDSYKANKGDKDFEIQNLLKQLADKDKDTDYLKTWSGELAAQLGAHKTKLAAAESQVRQSEIEIKQLKHEFTTQSQQIQSLEKQLSNEKKANDKLTNKCNGIESVFDKMKQGWMQMEQTLSCLSCLEFLGKDNPWTLICGHSICNKVSSNPF